MYISAMVCCCLALLTLSLSHFFSLHLLTLAGPLKALYLTEACKCCTHTQLSRKHRHTDTQTHDHIHFRSADCGKAETFFFCVLFALFIYLFIFNRKIMLLFDSWVCCDLHHKVVVTVTEDCRCFVLLLSGFQTLFKKRKKSQHMSQTVIYIFFRKYILESLQCII